MPSATGSRPSDYSAIAALHLLRLVLQTQSRSVLESQRDGLTRKPGDTVLIEGKVALNEEFGSGYKYAVLVEDATVTVE